MNKIRWIILAAALLCCIVFIIPWASFGILNIGNLTGLAICVLLIGYGIWMPFVHKCIRHLWQGKRLKWLVAAAGVFAAIVAVIAVTETACMIGACMKAPAQNATAIVLGCRVYGERPSLMLTERLEAAYEYLLNNPEADCVVSGGQGPDEDISEAECMKRWLVDKGIDKSRIYMEDKSTSTEENIAYSKEIIVAEGLDPRVTIITNDFHTYRGSEMAENQGLEYGVAPAKTAIWLLPTYYVRELYAILAEWIF